MTRLFRKMLIGAAVAALGLPFSFGPVLAQESYGNVAGDNGAAPPFNTTVPTLVTPVMKTPFLTGGVSAYGRLRLSRQGGLADRLARPPAPLPGSVAGAGAAGQSDAPLGAESAQTDQSLFNGDVASMFAATAQSAPPPAPPADGPQPANPSAPYVWTQSKDGGYYDASGHYKGTVWGDRLRYYGGHFANGDPVMNADVKINSMGQIWYQPGLSKGYFWNKQTNSPIF